LVNQCHRYPVLSQKIRVTSINPILVPDFDRRLVAFWEFFEEWLESGQKFSLRFERSLVEIPELRDSVPNATFEDIARERITLRFESLLAYRDGSGATHTTRDLGIFDSAA
jgi:hypothetical protein